MTIEKHHMTTVNKYSILLFIATLFGGVVLYFGGLLKLVERWNHQPEYSHGFLVPLVSLYILWESRRCWMVGFGSMSSFWKGFGFFIMAMLLLLVGEISALYILIHISFLIFLSGVVLMYWGGYAKSFCVPIALLIFTIPLPYIVEVLLTAKLQLISSSIGVSLIKLFGVPVYLSGNLIDLGEFKLQVVEACSGLRYLYPFACLGVILAYFYNAGPIRKVLVVVFTVPLAILLNSFRIAVTGLLVEHRGLSVAEGFLHDFEGWLVFLICVVLLLGIIYFLEKIWGGRSFVQAFSMPDYEARNEGGEGVNEVESGWKRFLLPLAIMGGVLVAITGLSSSQETGVQVKTLRSFPLSIQSWVGVRKNIDPDVIKYLGLSDYMLISYKNSSMSAELYVAYYENQRKGVSPHSPKVCIPGGGWEITDFQRSDIDGMPVNKVVIQKGLQRQLVYYWFYERGTVVANEYYKKYLLLKDVILASRSDGALIRIVVPLEENQELDSIAYETEAFIKTIGSKLSEYLPGE